MKSKGVRPYKKTSQSELLKAWEWIKEGNKVAEAEKRFDIPRSTLYRFRRQHGTVIEKIQSKLNNLDKDPGSRSSGNPTPTVVIANVSVRLKRVLLNPNIKIKIEPIESVERNEDKDDSLKNRNNQKKEVDGKKSRSSESSRKFRNSNNGKQLQLQKKMNEIAVKVMKKPNRIQIQEESSQTTTMEEESIDNTTSPESPELIDSNLRRSARKRKASTMFLSNDYDLMPTRMLKMEIKEVDENETQEIEPVFHSTSQISKRKGGFCRKTKWTDEDLKAAVEDILIRKCRNIDTAKKYGISSATLQRQLKLHRPSSSRTRANKNWTQQDLWLAMVDILVNKCSVSDTERKYGISTSTLSRELKVYREDGITRSALEQIKDMKLNIPEEDEEEECNQIIVKTNKMVLKNWKPESEHNFAAVFQRVLDEGHVPSKQAIYLWLLEIFIDSGKAFVVGNWLDDFLERHPHISTRLSEGYEQTKTKATEPAPDNYEEGSNEQTKAIEAGPGTYNFL